MKPEKLKTQVKKGSEIQPTLIKQMYNPFMHLNPSVPKETDYSCFESMVKRAHKVYHFINPENRIMGFYIVYKHK